MAKQKTDKVKQNGNQIEEYHIKKSG